MRGVPAGGGGGGGEWSVLRLQPSTMQPALCSSWERSLPGVPGVQKERLEGWGGHGQDWCSHGGSHNYQDDFEEEEIEEGSGE